MGYWEWLKEGIKSKEAKLFLKALLILGWIISGTFFGGLTYVALVGFNEVLAIFMAAIVVSVNSVFSISYLCYFLNYNDYP